MQQSAGTLDLCGVQIRASALEGESVSVTDLLADSLALTGSATLDGLTAQGNVGCDQLLCNDVNCTDVFTTGVDASGAVSCAALTAAGTVVHRHRVRQLAEHHGRGQRGPAELSHRNHGQHVDHQQHGQRRELHHGGRRVHGDIDGLGRSNRGELRGHRGAHGRHADHRRGGLRGPAGLREPGLFFDGYCTFTATSGGVSTGSVVCGLRAAALRLQHAHRDQHLRLLGRSLPDEELGGWSKLQISNNSAASDSGPELRLLGNQSARVFLSGTAGRTSASSS